MTTKINLTCKTPSGVVYNKKATRVLKGLLKNTSEHYAKKIIETFGAIKAGNSINGDQYSTFSQFLNDPNLEDIYNEYIPTRVDFQGDISTTALNFESVKDEINILLSDNDIFTNLQRLDSGEIYQCPQGNNYMRIVETSGRKRSVQILDSRGDIDICLSRNGGKYIIYDRQIDEILYISKEKYSFINLPGLNSGYIALTMTKGEILFIDEFGNEYISSDNISVTSISNQQYVLDKNTSSITILGSRKNIVFDTSEFLEVLGNHIYMLTGEGNYVLYDFVKNIYEDIQIDPDMSEIVNEKGFFYSMNCNKLFVINKYGASIYDRKKLPQEVELDLYESRGLEPPLSLEEEIQEKYERLN